MSAILYKQEESSNTNHRCWLLYEVNKYPEVLARLRAEHDAVLGRDPKDAVKVLTQNPNKLYELRYTNAVIKETLRLHVIGQTFRQGGESFSFQANGMRFPTDGCSE